MILEYLGGAVAGIVALGFIAWLCDKMDERKLRDEFLAEAGVSNGTDPMFSPEAIRAFLDANPCLPTTEGEK